MMQDLQEYGRDNLPDPERIGEEGYCGKCGIHPSKTPSPSMMSGECQCKICVCCYGSHCLAHDNRDCPVSHCRAKNSFDLEMDEDTTTKVLATMFLRLEEAEERLDVLHQKQSSAGVCVGSPLSVSSTVMQCPIGTCCFRKKVGAEFADSFQTLPGPFPHRNLKIIKNSSYNTVRGFRNTNPFKKMKRHVKKCVSQHLLRECEDKDLPIFYQRLSAYPNYKELRYGRNFADQNLYRLS